MKNKRTIIALGALGALLAASSSSAQPVPRVPGADAVYVVQPSEKDTYGCTFAGRTISLANKGSATVYLRKKKQADASPSAIVTNHSANSTENVDIMVHPDEGCGAAGCRNGNEYEIVLEPTDADGNTPVCNLYFVVQQKVLRRGDR